MKEAKTLSGVRTKKEAIEIALEEFARFDRVYIAYYPSARYFADLIASQYFHNIAGSKLMGDSFRVATAPITARL